MALVCNLFGVQLSLDHDPSDDCFLSFWEGGGALFRDPPEVRLRVIRIIFLAGANFLSDPSGIRLNKYRYVIQNNSIQSVQSMTSHLFSRSGRERVWKRDKIRAAGRARHDLSKCPAYDHVTQLDWTKLPTLKSTSSLFSLPLTGISATACITSLSFFSLIESSSSVMCFFFQLHIQLYTVYNIWYRPAHYSNGNLCTDINAMYQTINVTV